jgi:hypothetical protein
MNSFMHVKKAASVFLVGWLCFGLLPTVQAISPDGCLPGGNTAEGCNALLSLTTGTFNTAVGFDSLLSNTDANFNTGVGAGTLLLNTAGENTATGAGALLSNTIGEANTADGAFALFSNTATGNTAIGSRALLNNTTGGTLGTTLDIDVGPNTAVGSHALESNTISSANTAVGYQALRSMVTGFDFGTGPTDLGVSTAVGFQALASANGTNSAANDAFGYQALTALTDGIDNVAIGALAGVNLTSGSNNVFIGTSAGSGVTTASGVIAISSSADDVSNSCYIAHIWGGAIDPGSALNVIVDSNGKLGTTASSRRFKHDIKPMDQTSEAVLALKPVTFQYKSDKKGTPQFGLVAEDVEAVNPDLVVRDKEGKPYSVRYDQVNAMLLNEFLKEHNTALEERRKVEKLEGTVAGLVATVKEQAVQIQKVNAQLEASKPAPQVVNNP